MTARLRFPAAVPALLLIVTAMTAPAAAQTCFDYGGAGAPTVLDYDPAGDDDMQDIVLVGDRAYVTSNIYGNLIILDVADPGNPVELGRVAVGSTRLVHRFSPCSPLPSACSDFHSPRRWGS